MKERKSVLENFIFRNEYTHFIGHLELWGTLGFIFIDIREREDKIKYAANWGN